MMFIRLLACGLVQWCFVSVVVAQSGPSLMELPADVRGWFRNPDGSCVQCSIGMCGVWCNQPAASTLLWDSPFGRAERGGSGPDRVRRYCDARKIRAWNVTGRSTFEWMRWAALTGRFAAIGAGGNHFQTLYGYDERRRVWLVCNNNSTGRIDEYDDAAFRRLHLASGPWVVVLQEPGPAVPEYVSW